MMTVGSDPQGQRTGDKKRVAQPIQRVARGRSTGFRGVAGDGETLEYCDPDTGKTPFGANPLLAVRRPAGAAMTLLRPHLTEL